MKTVFTNHMVAHVFAQQQQQNGTSGNGAFSFFGSELKSYNTVIGKFVKPDLLLVNSYSYSVTTTQHISLLRNAISGNVTVLECPNVVINLFIRNAYTLKQNKIAHTENLSYFKNEIKQNVLKASRARSNKEMYNGAALAMLTAHNEYLNVFKLRFKAATLPNLASIKLDALKAANAKARKAKAAAKKARIDNAQKITDWLAGENVRVPHNVDVMVRLNNDTIETSQGAQFPAAHGYMALTKIKACKAAAKGWQRNGQNIRLGHFQIDEIDTLGNVKAGCHKVKYAQIIRIESELLTWRANSKNEAVNNV
jgi:hypothetical protein